MAALSAVRRVPWKALVKVAIWWAIPTLLFIFTKTPVASENGMIILFVFVGVPLAFLIAWDTS